LLLHFVGGKNPHAYEPDRPNKRDKPNKPDRPDMSNVETRPLSLKKSKVGEKEKYFIPFNQLYFLKSRLRSAIKTGESHPERAWS